MAIYKYRARTGEGQIKKGAVEATSDREAADLLNELGLYVLKLEHTSAQKVSKGINLNLGRVGGKDLVIFSRQLSVMMSATVPIVQALKILAKQTPNPIFVEKINEMSNDVNGGMKLSDALNKHSKIFGHFYVAMVRSGETSGKLEEILHYLADQMEKDFDLMSKIKGAMIYPIFIVSAMVSVGFLMMIFVFPKLTVMLEETGTELPLVTKILIATSGFISTYWYVVVGGVAGLALFLRFWMSTPKGRFIADRSKLMMPIFGTLFKKIYVVRMTRSLSTLVKGGVPIANSLKITAEVVDNKAYEKLILDTVDEVEGGSSVSTLFVRSKIIPQMLSQMMIIGEQTGKLDSVLDKLSDFYTREIDNMVNDLTALIEPLILVVMGVGVAGLVAAIMLPMFQVAQSF